MYIYYNKLYHTTYLNTIVYYYYNFFVYKLFLHIPTLYFFTKTNST